MYIFTKTVVPFIYSWFLGCSPTIRAEWVVVTETSGSPTLKYLLSCPSEKCFSTPTLWQPSSMHSHSGICLLCLYNVLHFYNWVWLPNGDRQLCECSHCCFFLPNATYRKSISLCNLCLLVLSSLHCSPHLSLFTAMWVCSFSWNICYIGASWDQQPLAFFS